MNFDVTQLAPRDAYKLLTGVVVPRPIALVTSRSETGVLNAAPFSFFNLVGANPPLVVLGVGDKGQETPKDTARNIRQTREFVVNMVSEELVEAMNICAVDFPSEISEIEAARLETAPSSQIGTPRLAQTPAALECREHATLHIGGNRLIIGEVVALYIPDEFVDAEKNYVQSAALKLVGRMGGAGGYIYTDSTFELARLSYEEWREREDTL
jgi:flavin reductase (DIM6/NTAB) family NADH-FMN oxidoreductase RutF